MCTCERRSRGGGDGCLLLREAADDAETLAANREALQGRAKDHTGGRSTTMVYAYTFTLCRRAVIATMDLAAANRDFFQTHHWLSASENVIVLELTAPAWRSP